MRLWIVYSPPLLPSDFAHTRARFRVQHTGSERCLFSTGQGQVPSALSLAVGSVAWQALPFTLGSFPDTIGTSSGHDAWKTKAATEGYKDMAPVGFDGLMERSAAGEAHNRILYTIKCNKEARGKVCPQIYRGGLQRRERLQGIPHLAVADRTVLPEVCLDQSGLGMGGVALVAKCKLDVELIGLSVKGEAFGK
ncbi:hypothetical protein FDECE_2647 [Fusarium decemcellulare]|nr:hypothetical protein FDECE_2647 [Fusarium decemcellulare]